VTDDLRDRLWRVRRRAHRIDAIVRQLSDGWELTFVRNDKPMLSSIFGTRSKAVSDADRRLRELQRAGWTVHW